MIRLRITAELEFDSYATAKAYAVAYGWSLGQMTDTALKTSESTAPAVRRTRPIEVVEVTAGVAEK